MFKNNKNSLRGLWKLLVSQCSRVQAATVPSLPSHGGPRTQGDNACATLPHLFPSREVPFLLGLEPGGLSPGADGPPEVPAGPPPRWPSPEFCLLQYSEEEAGKEPLWLKAEVAGSKL